MQTELLINGIAVEGNRLANAAEVAGLDAKVPSCPRWKVRDLVRHSGGIHRWAGAHVRTPQKDLINPGPLASQFGGWPDDAVLIDWYRAEVLLLVESLRNSPDDIQTACFLRADSPKHFWARRQCHEVEIHRVDAELAASALTPIDPHRAGDGIDELLMGFVSRKTGKLRSDVPITMVIAPEDIPECWTVVISHDPPAVSQNAASGPDLVTRGPVDVLYRCLWNRAGPDELNLEGDPYPLSLFKSSVKIRWS